MIYTMLDVLLFCKSQKYSTPSPFSPTHVVSVVDLGNNSIGFNVHQNLGVCTPIDQGTLVINKLVQTSTSLRIGIGFENLNSIENLYIGRGADEIYQLKYEDLDFPIWEENLEKDEDGDYSLFFDMDTDAGKAFQLLTKKDINTNVNLYISTNLPSFANVYTQNCYFYYDYEGKSTKTIYRFVDQNTDQQYGYFDVNTDYGDDGTSDYLKFNLPLYTPLNVTNDDNIATMIDWPMYRSFGIKADKHNAEFESVKSITIIHKDAYITLRRN